MSEICLRQCHDTTQMITHTNDDNLSAKEKAVAFPHYTASFHTWPFERCPALRHQKHRPSLINFARSSSVNFCLLNRWPETSCSVEATLSVLSKARQFRLLPTDPRGCVSTAFRRAVRAARIASDRVLWCSRMASARKPSESPRTKSNALEWPSKAVKFKLRREKC